MVQAATSAARGFVLPGPGLFRFEFGVPGSGWGTGYWDAVPPIDGTDLDDFMQGLVAGITGVDPTLVRPRFQTEPPNYPARTNWVAIGVTENIPDPGWAYVQHDHHASGRDYVQQHEVFTLVVSSYGPRADYIDGTLRDGLQVSQNRELLQLTAMGLVDVGTKTVVPRLLNQRWHRRVDRRYRFRRLLRQVYPVLNILRVVFTVDGETAALSPLPPISGGVNSPSTN